MGSINIWLPEVRTNRHDDRDGINYSGELLYRENLKE
jgi:hypothetical protein